MVSLLRQNGWPERHIYQAFGALYEQHIGKPVPSGDGRVEAAKDAFLYLLAFITLAIWAVQLGALFFTAIDRRIPDRAAELSPGPAPGAMAGELAAIMIAREVRRQPGRLDSPVRSWLTYIALVATASTVIGDIVTFLTYFLSGELDARFLLKLTTVLVISGGVFAYYLTSLRSDEPSGRNRLFGIAASIIVLLALIVGFNEIGSPKSQRLNALDSRRLWDRQQSFPQPSRT